MKKTPGLDHFFKKKESQKSFFKIPDREPPVIDFCQSPPIFLVDSSDDISRGFITDIEWSEPIFHDNSLDDVSIDVQVIEQSMMML